MNFKDAHTIYKTIAKANGFIIRPWFSYDHYHGINAYVNLFYIWITDGALKSYNPNEMALTIGHELAHWRNMDNFRFWASRHKLEFDADALGAEYATTAGFSVVKGVSKFDKFMQIETETHPHPQDRKERLLKIYE